MPQPSDNIITPTFQHCLARALYDNLAEAPDELAFRRGDVLVVLEQNTGNLEGWWLCALRGRQGICPGNRLRLIAGAFEDFASPQSSDVNLLQKQGKRRSWHVQPNKVLTPKKYNDVYLYDMPPARCSPLPVHAASPSVSPRENNDCYDVPPRAVPLDTRNCLHCSPVPSCASPNNKECETYDIPRPLLNQNDLTPSSSASSLTADSISSSNRSSMANMPDYDIPRPLNKTLHVLPHLVHPSDVSHQYKELPLEINSALETLERLQAETTGAISMLLSYVYSHCWSQEKLETNLMDIKLVVIRLKTALHDYAEFCEGTLGNATKATDKNLAQKLLPLVLALRNSDKLVSEVTEKLQQQEWSVQMLKSGEIDKACKPDELEQLVVCSRTLIEDIRQTASFIQGNSTLLFKKEFVASNNNEWLEEYDYVNLDSKDATHKKHAEIRDSLPKELKKGYESLVQTMDDIAIDNKMLDHDEKQILTFFATQAVTHHKYLTQAIDAFLQTVEHNQPPKIFLAHGKFVVLSAHKLIHIGDAVHRNVCQPEIKSRALICSDALSATLETAVTKIKQAALHFPSVTAVQEMVDSIVDISHLAKDVKLCIIQAVHPI